MSSADVSSKSSDPIGAKSVASRLIGFAISKQALAGATTLAHAAKGFHRRDIHRHYPDGAIGFNDPFQPLGWAEGEARPNRSRDNGLPPGGDGTELTASPLLGPQLIQ